MIFSLFPLCLGLLGILHPAVDLYPSGNLHPMDGPDVEVRIYIEDDEVRLILSPNLAYVDATVDVARENEEFIHPVEMEAVREELFEHARESLLVTVDGVRVVPLDREFRLFDADPTLLPLFPRFGRLALTRVEQTLAFPCKAPPGRVEIEWPDFPDDPQQPDGSGGFARMEINGRLFALDRESLVQFSLRDPRYVWVRDEASRTAEPLPVPEPTPAAAGFPVRSFAAFFVAAVLGLLFLKRAPFVALGLVFFGGWIALELRPDDSASYALPDEAQALAAFKPIHANLYRAFDYTDEDAIYDSLAQSAEGPLLDSLYRELYESMRLEEDGAAESFVRSVEPEETKLIASGHYPPDDAPGFEIDTRWRVEGQVFHWGHSHTRTNVYRARYTVVATDAGWRLRDSEVLEHARERSANDTDDMSPPSPKQSLPPEYQDL